MRIDRLEIKNFKKFTQQAFEFNQRFTLLVGDNGAGKTSVLDALAVSLGVWLVEAPDTFLDNSGRIILPTEIRLEPSLIGDRVQFRECRPVEVSATGRIGEVEDVTWTRRIGQGGKRTSNAEAMQALSIIKEIYRRDKAGDPVICPVLAYYGAGRGWLPSNQRMPPSSNSSGPARRWAAFYDCFNERIRFAELNKWFENETIEAGNRQGRIRPGFAAVKRAILRCVPDAKATFYSSDRKQIVLSVNGNAQPFDHLSAGQRMMLALVADIAIKAVTQNAVLLPPEELGPEDEPLPRVLAATPGVVLIDELDVHLHPKWQRRVAADLKRTFPGLQFICTSHSPQVIGEVGPEEIRVLGEEGSSTPPRSFGLDTSRILEEVMDARPRNADVEVLLKKLFTAIDQETFDEARDLLREVETQLGPEDPEVTRARTCLSFLESKA